MSGDTFTITPEDRQTLLQLARATLDSFVHERTRPDPANIQLSPEAHTPRATFITLRNDDRLRGCIGSVRHEVPLAQSILDNTIRSASADPRFDPIAPGELTDISIEISALADGDKPHTPFRRLDSPREIQIGDDGLYLEHNGRGKGLLLPQVATDRGWTADQFLDALCHKSGLPPGAWEDPRVTLYRFSAHIFSDADY